MNIIIKDEPKMHDGVAALKKRNNDVRLYHSRRLARQNENWYFYWGLDPELGRGQWPSSVVSQMLEQKRQLLTYNFAKVIVDTAAGGTLQNLYHPKFISQDKRYSKTIEALEKLSYADKELMNWDAAWLEYVIQGYVGEGCMKIVISREFDDLGNIGYKPMIVGGFVTDPAWMSRSVKDLNFGLQQGWWTPEELIRFFPAKTDAITSAIYSKNAKNPNPQPAYGTNTGITPFNTGEDEWGDRKLCISEYRMVERKKECECVLVNSEEVEIPDIEDSLKPSWLNKNYPDWQPDFVYSKPKIIRECRVKVCCPTLVRDGFLYDGLAQVQCGHPPFHIWSSSMHNGERHTMIDAIKDACRNINYWESMATYKLQVEGGGGAAIADEEGFDSHEEFKDACNNRNDPTKVFKAKRGSLINNMGKAMQPLIERDVRGDIFNHINHIIQILPSISKINPATLGRVEEGNQTSGRLQRLLKIQGDQQVFTTSLGLKLNFADIFDSYYITAIDLYSNEDVERKFTYDSGRQEVVLNQRGYDEYGQPVILNRVSDLKNIRHKTIVGETTSSPTKQANNVELMRGFLESLGPLAQVKPLTVSLVTMKMAENMDMFDEEDKDAMKKAAAVENELQLTKMELDISNTKLQKLQIDMQLQGAGQVSGVSSPGAPPNPVMGNGRPTTSKPRNEPAIPQGLNIKQNPSPQGEEVL